jgi:hypothetical protein
MGHHTWFHKDRETYEKLEKLYEKSDQHEDGEIYLEPEELSILNLEIDNLYDANDTEFHDCFRSIKKDEYGNWADDKIYSREECLKWLEDNKEVVYNLNLTRVHQFWDKYPNGVIDFG